MLLPLADIFTTAQGWIETGGYAVLFGILVGCGMGLPVPEDIPLIIAGALVQQGKMHLAIAAIACWCGIIGGDCILYSLGRRYGRGITRVPIIGTHVTAARLAWVERKFGEYGVWVVAIGRLFAGVRGAMVIVAGVTRYSFLKFIIADGIAALLSGGMFMALGYWLAHKLPELMKDVDAVKKLVGVALVLVIAAVGGWMYWRNFKLKRAIKREAAGLCPACAYDMRETPLVCPECGWKKPVTATSVETITAVPTPPSVIRTQSLEPPAT